MFSTLPDKLSVFLSNIREGSGGFSTLECSISFSHANCPFKLRGNVTSVNEYWHSRSCCVKGFTGCIPLGSVASRYNIFRFVFVFYQTSKLKRHHLHFILWLLLILCTIMATQNDWTKFTYITKNWSSVENTVLNAVNFLQLNVANNLLNNASR